MAIQNIYLYIPYTATKKIKVKKREENGIIIITAMGYGKNKKPKQKKMYHRHRALVSLTAASMLKKTKRVKREDGKEKNKQKTEVFRIAVLSKLLGKER